MPSKNDLDLKGLNIKDSEVTELLSVDAGRWGAEIPEIEEFIAGFGKRLPARMKVQLEKMSKRLGNA